MTSYFAQVLTMKYTVFLLFALISSVYAASLIPPNYYPPDQECAIFNVEYRNRVFDNQGDFSPGHVIGSYIRYNDSTSPNLKVSYGRATDFIWAYMCIIVAYQGRHVWCDTRSQCLYTKLGRCPYWYRSRRFCINWRKFLCLIDHFTNFEGVYYRVAILSRVSHL